MKFIIQKKNKRFLLLVLCLAIVVIGLQIYTSVTSPGTVVNETVLFEYSFQPSLISLISMKMMSMKVL